MDEYSSRDPRGVDELFLERLETFMDKCLADIQAFSERELRPFEETRRSVAEWHAKHLFHPSPSSSTAKTQHEYVHSVLVDTSRVLESLAETAGVQAFLLAVDPCDKRGSGFLGGSINGREFWRGLRGGGEHGAKAFRHYCLTNGSHPSKAPKAINSQVLAASSSGQPIVAMSNKLDAKSVKADLYETVRRALKSASGIRNAEMKWANPERLDLYGVRLVGWPSGIPPQNPSSLKMSQNKQLLDAFQGGTARFERLLTSADPVPPPEIEVDNADDFSWAYDPEASPRMSYNMSATAPGTVRTPSGLSSPRPAPSAASTRENTPLPQSGSWDASSSSFNPRDSTEEDWDEDIRCRKRPRSQSPDRPRMALTLRMVVDSQDPLSSSS